jgi:hypothetical protein
MEPHEGKKLVFFVDPTHRKKKAHKTTTAREEEEEEEEEHLFFLSLSLSLPLSLFWSLERPSS